MMKRTHIFMGMAITLPFITWNNALFFPAAIAGAFAPDLDYVICKRHREIAHSLFALILTSAAMLLINIDLGFLCFLNYGSHLLLDSFTTVGVPLFYPFSNKYHGFKLIKSRGSGDMFIALMLLYLIVVAINRK